MLRISRDKPINGSVNVRLEGELTGPWVEETRRVCEAATAHSDKLRLDLTSVSFVDREGLKLLAQLQKTDAALENCSGFLKAQLRSAQKKNVSSARAADEQFRVSACESATCWDGH